MQIYLISGEMGSGKSTLAMAIVGRDCCIERQGKVLEIYSNKDGTKKAVTIAGVVTPEMFMHAKDELKKEYPNAMFMNIRTTKEHK
jgi:ABC-type dipeptide/oligopeptide/nickel transport system ATPase subunit